MIVSKQNLIGKLLDKQSLQGNINKAIEYINPTTQEKTITPTKQVQEVLPDENVDLLSKVTVNAIPNEYIIPQGEIEITENGIADVTQYASANINVSGAKVYPPNWSEIGYEDTPANIIEGFNYAKEIQNNWDSSITSMNNKYASDVKLQIFPLVDTSNITTMNYAFSGSNLGSIALINTSNVVSINNTFRGCNNLIEVPLINTGKVVDFTQCFAACPNLREVPVLDTSSVTTFSFNNVFQNCPTLSNESLNNILQMCINAVKVTSASYKNLKKVGLSSAQATICQGLSNYQAFLNAGWTTGY